MARRKAAWRVGWLVTLAVLAGPALPVTASAEPQAQGGALDPAYLDKLLAPVALYPDQLLAQMLLCSGNPRKVGELSAWLKQTSALKGSELQKAAEQAGFEPSFVALAPFPQVVDFMAGNLTWTSQLGGAFAIRSRGGVRRDPAAAEAEPDGGQPEEHAAADGGDADHQGRRAGDRDRAGEPAGGLRPAVQPAGGVHAGRADHRRRAGRRRRRGGRRRDRLRRRDRDRRGDRQQLLPRAVRLARRRLHVQRRVGRLVRRPRRRARGLLREPRGRARGLRRTTGRTWPASGPSGPRTRASSAASGPRATQQQRTERQETRGTPEAQAQRDQQRAEAQGRAQEARSTRLDEREHDLGTRFDDVGFDPARQRRAAHERRAQRHALRLVLRLLERSLDAVRELARQPQPLGRRRRSRSRRR